MMRSDTDRSNSQSHSGSMLAALEQTVAPALLDGKLASDVVRVWVPGCASGALTYAIARMLYACAQQRRDPPSIKIFATDPDASAIALARQGRHSNNQPHDLIAVHVRSLITFAQHPLLWDPPFAGLDVIVCDALLAEHSEEAQAQILNQFHWSLKPGGYLLVGAQADSVELSTQFTRISSAGPLFQRRGRIDYMPFRPASKLAAAQPADDRHLQIANQQLLAMNQALRRKVAELGQAIDDLDNLLRATDLMTIFLDRELQITRFTPQAQKLFHLLPTDRGRPLAHITHMLDYNELVQDAEAVRKSLQTCERVTQATDGSWYLVRQRPYRTGDDRIDGVVLICIDITARVVTEADMRRARDELELRVRERTEELSTMNTQLQAEIVARAQLEQERAELLRKLIMMQEDERRRIARELHDQLGQSVTALNLGLGRLGDRSISVEQHQQIVAHLQRLTALIDQDMSRLAMDLRPTALDDLGLVPALQYYIARWGEQAGIQIELQITDLEHIRLPSELESMIYRVIQEALTNVLKHARARRVSVLLQQRRGDVRVIIEDDGRGFDTDALEQQANTRRRLGLVGMRERIALVGGSMTIETALGAGTTLFVQVPISAQASEEPADA